MQCSRGDFTISRGDSGVDDSDFLASSEFSCGSEMSGSGKCGLYKCQLDTMYIFSPGKSRSISPCICHFGGMTGGTEPMEGEVQESQLRKGWG